MMLETLREAPARLARGFERTVRNARGYRYEGERAAHADQLRQTQISLSLMESASSDDPAQTIMASDIEDDSENRLIVLLGKARLTLEEKRERDAIQAALSRRRQALAGNVELVRAAAPARAHGLLGPIAGGPLAGVLASPMTWVALAFALPATWGGIQTARLNHAKGDLREARADVRRLERESMALAAERDLLADAARAADAQSRATAETIEQERARRLRAEREARRIRDAMDQARAGAPVDYGFDGVRDDGAASPSAGGDNPAGGGSR